VAQWVFDHGQMAGLGTDTLPGGDTIFLPLRSTAPAPGNGGTTAAAVLGVLAVLPANARRVLLPEQMHLLETFAGQIGLALERAHLAELAQQAEVEAGNERVRSSLLSAISHDLRTPLAVIAGSASTLADGGAGLDEKTRREMALAIFEQAGQMTQLVSNILDMTRFEAATPRLNRQWHPLEEIVGAVLNRMQDRLGRRKVHVDLPDDLPLVSIDGVLIEQVFANLLENALKYTPSESPLEIAASATTEKITVSVVDSGPGVRPGDEQRVFDKFYRANPESAVGGAGLGLTICRAIIEAHGGEIWMENRFAGGAMFCFTLPLHGSPPEMEKEGDS
jgi:two-component system sensor histidine kinase KdpD